MTKKTLSSEALLDLAARARLQAVNTPGPYRQQDVLVCCDAQGSVVADCSNGGEDFNSPEEWQQANHDAAYFAMLDPDTVLTLTNMARQCARVMAELDLHKAAIAYIERKVEGYNTTFEVAEEIVAGLVTPDGKQRKH